MTGRTVVFRHPFVLAGFERVEPAGSYVVETEEEEIEGLFVTAWRRMATIMHLTHEGATEYVKIDPADLEKALMRDAGPPETPLALSARLDAQRLKNHARLARRKKF